MIQINVEARCQAITRNGTQCTKEATKYEGQYCRNDGETELFVELVNSVSVGDGHIYPPKRHCH